jgi:hypothetical protein
MRYLLFFIYILFSFNLYASTYSLSGFTNGQSFVETDCPASVGLFNSSCPSTISSNPKAILYSPVQPVEQYREFWPDGYSNPSKQCYFKTGTCYYYTNPCTDGWLPEIISPTQVECRPSSSVSNNTGGSQSSISIVQNALDCGSQNFAVAVTGGFACYTQQPDNTNCKVNIGVSGSFVSNYSCTNVNPSSSGANTSTGTSTSSGTGTSTAAATSTASGASTGTAASTASNNYSQSQCEATFGAGNCSTNLTDTSKCSGLYKLNGNTYCVANTSGTGSNTSTASTTSTGSNNSTGSNTNNSSGTNNSTAGNNSSTGTNSSQAGQCDPTSKNYLGCIGSDKKALPKHVETDSGAKTIDEVNQNFINRLNKSPVVKSFNNIKNVVSVSGAQCPDFRVPLFGREISTPMHCILWNICALVLSPVMFAVWTILAFRIFASA